MSKFLEAFKAEIDARENANVFFIGEYHNGKIETMRLQQTNPCQDTYSVSKAFVVTAIGMLVDRGLLTTDETLTDILADELPETYNEVWTKTTVHMLLLHKVGLSGGFLDIDCFDATQFGDDYLAYVLNAPIAEDFDLVKETYTDAAFYLLSRIVEKRAGMRTDDFLWQNLFYPTGCREAAWSHCPKGHAMGATGLYIRVEDMLKHGMIYLNGGMYEGKRILSEEWVKTVIDNGYELKSCGGGKAYGKGGMRGQKMMVVPAQNRVVAWLGCGDNGFTDFCANYED